jgi:hypothetical protein
MKRIATVLIYPIIFLLAACVQPTKPVVIPGVSLIDSTILVPSFNMVSYPLTNAEFVNLIKYEGSLRIFFVRYTGSYQILTAELNDLNNIDTLKTELDAINCLDCKHDKFNSMVMMTYATSPSFADDYIKFGVYYSGGLLTQTVSRGAMQTDSRLEMRDDDSWDIVHGSLSSGSQKIYRKSIDFYTTYDYTITPANNNTNNSYLLHDFNAGPLTAQSFRTSINVGHTAVMGAMTNNIYEFGSNYVENIPNSNWHGDNPAYDIAALGENELYVYESQIDSAMDYINGPVLDYTEHIRMSLTSYSYESTPLGNYENGYVEEENAVILPMTMGPTDEVSQIACANNFNKSEVAIAYLRNGYLFFTIAKMVDQDVRIGPIQNLGPVTYNNLTEFKILNWDKYYISVYNAGNLEVFTSN